MVLGSRRGLRSLFSGLEGARKASLPPGSLSPPLLGAGVPISPCETLAALGYEPLIFPIEQRSGNHKNIPVPPPRTHGARDPLIPLILVFWIYTNGHLLDQPFRIAHKTGAAFRQFRRPEGAFYLQPMATPSELVSQIKYALQGAP